MNSKIIFFDIDGTIINNNTSKISESTKAAIKQAQANGHLAFINTGRTIGEIEEEVTRIGFDGYVCGCGTYISYKDSVLFQDTIPLATTKELVADLRKYKIEAILEGMTTIYYDDYITNPVIKRIKEEHSTFFDVKSWDAPDISIDKFCIWPNSKEAFIHFYEKYKDNFDFIKRADSFSEVIPTGYSKATGIHFILSHLNIPYENTYALGDSANDIPMLQCVKHSIAMGNSSAEIRKQVSYVTEDVDNGGVSNALKHFNII